MNSIIPDWIRIPMHGMRSACPGEKGSCAGKDGLVSQNALGCYTHAYFTPAFARKFVEAATAILKELKTRAVFASFFIRKIKSLECE